MSDVLLLNADGSPLSLLPLSIISWKLAMKIMIMEKAKVIKYYDDWVVHTPSTEIRVPSVLMTTEYIKWSKSVKYNKYNLFLRDEYVCQYCLNEIPPHSLTIDHVVPRSYGGKSSWDNVVAACKKCNTTRGNNINIKPNVNPWRPTYYELASKRKKFPLTIKDDFWLTFIDWPPNLINIQT